jgi:hypothetical protein
VQDVREEQLCHYTIEREGGGGLGCLAMFSFWLHLLRTKGVQELVLRGLRLQNERQDVLSLQQSSWHAEEGQQSD